MFLCLIDTKCMLIYSFCNSWMLSFFCNFVSRESQSGLCDSRKNKVQAVVTIKTNNYGLEGKQTQTHPGKRRVELLKSVLFLDLLTSGFPVLSNKTSESRRFIVINLLFDFRKWKVYIYFDFWRWFEDVILMFIYVLRNCFQCTCIP